MSYAESRFNLLLLSEKEYYFDDHSAYFYPASASEQESFRRRCKGRLKICSGSVIFDPEDITVPVLKVPFANTKEVVPFRGSLTGFLGTKATELFVVSTDLVIEVKKNNKIGPYNLVKGNATLTFSLNYTNLPAVLTQINKNRQLAALPYAKREVPSLRYFESTVEHFFVIFPEISSALKFQASFAQIIETMEREKVFDPSWIVDINERPQIELNAYMVTPLVTNPGRLMITDQRLYFQPINNVDPTPVKKYNFADITFVAKRRHVLRNTGIELVFGQDFERSVFFAFKSSHQREDVYDTLTRQPKIHLASQDTHGVTQKWRRGEISNFDYLMHLNRAAGRTFNDLTQYPVMPWVIADYEHSFLDLSQPETFRDLSRPIGALNEERLAYFLNRYENMPDDPGTPRFMYGTHYSAPAYVLFYLVRIKPEFMLRLQGGNFDAADRMFHSMTDTWRQVLVNPTDVKELIPEFYQLPEAGEKNFLLNADGLDMGTRSSGEKLNHVVLPPWADSAEDFIKKCRAALESEYVSQNLHHWIDLIFGYKQLGEEAVKAHNLFYHLTYEGAVDMESVTDPAERASLEVQINEFGQTPKQIFTYPHPKRLSESERQAELETLSGSLSGSAPQTWANLPNLVPTFGVQIHKDIISDFCLLPSEEKLYSVSNDTMVKIYSLTEKRQLRSFQVSDLALTAIRLVPQSETNVVVSSWDNNIYLFNCEFGRSLDVLHAHDDSVSCIGLQPFQLITGSWDHTVKTWKFRSSGIEKVPTNDFDNDSEVRSLDLAQDSNIAVWGLDDGNIVSVDLRAPGKIRTIAAHRASVNSVRLTPDGSKFVSCSADGYAKAFDLGGSELSSANLGETLNAVATDGNVYVVGGAQQLRAFQVNSGTELSLQSGKGLANVTSLHASPRGTTLVCGTANGTLFAWK